MLRPTFLDHENDAQTYADTDDFLLGRDLLVASVVEQGADKRRIYLPENHAGWWDYWTGQLHAPGTWFEKPVTLADMPLFVKAGSILPLANEATKATREAQVGRTLALFPQPGSFSCTSLIYDDDGESKMAHTALPLYCLAAMSMVWNCKSAMLAICLCLFHSSI
ncbi:hypothetical protein HORIV_14820 [Vreelandella olivaria]|uniref:Glycosyl hydrolase family 31 C-terminal domain-containing protein n=1 Tax=Vreelandella olivaria TaxID=390919 RepID=A0ABM7GF87_9GAMM|nr:hypothetical protein HORIV_14820 [Halomonas olivaria]